MRGSRRSGESGAVLVEAAIVTPLVVAMVSALVVVSVLWRDQLAADDAAAAGARAAALYPAERDAADPGEEASLPAGTPLVAAAVARALGGVPLRSVERVVVFGTTLGTGDAPASVPAGCRTGLAVPDDEPCVVLEAGMLADPASAPSCGRGECGWRDAPGVTAVGVLVRLRHPGPLWALVPAPTIERVALAAIEGGARD